MNNRTPLQNAGLAIGLLAVALTLILPAPAAMEAAAWRTAGVTVLMAVWWATEALPLAATALAPVVLLTPLGVSPFEKVTAPYANETIFLILGGFLLGVAMQRWNLHKRIAYSIVLRAGARPRALVLGVMCATAFISLWTSNTSTTLMMLPVALSIAAVLAPPGETLDRDQRNFATALVLSVAYAASIGGLGTLIGSPTNALVAGFMRQNFDVDVSFTDWLVFGLPAVFLLLPAAWLVLTRVSFPFELSSGLEAHRAVREAHTALGPMSRAEHRVAVVFVLTATAWIARGLLEGVPAIAGIGDATIGILAGLTLFILPAGSADGALLRGEDMMRVPWDVLLLFGGGLSLAAAIQGSGLSAFIGMQLSGLGGLPLPLLVLAVVLLLVFWTELNSNVAAAATFMPIVAALATASTHPVLALVAPTAMAASAGFMMPVGTPPNAIVYGTGRVTMREMMRAGILVDILAVVVIALVAWLTLPWMS